MATNTTTTSTSHTGNTTAGPFAISFTYVKNTDIDVTVAGVLKTLGTHYTFTSATQITFTSGNEPANGAAIVFRRNTNVSTKAVDFQDGSVLTETDLDTSTDQLINGIQEIADDYVKRDGTQTITGNLVFEGATDDANETTLAITDPTADRTITLPDTTGTVVTTGDTGTVSSTMITNGTIVDADINASAAIAGSKLQAASGSNAGSMSASDKTKLDGIEASATADQTAAEIRTLVENATDSNVFTDADHTKLNGIETSATADQTAAEIRTLVESATDSNVFTDADHSKLNAIEANATADQTDAEIRAAVEAASDSNVFTDADHSKLNGIEASADVTDATNVNAAGAVMNTDLATKGQILVGDGTGDPTALSVGQNNYVLVADSNEATGVKWATVPAGSGLSNVVEDTTPQLGGNLDVQASEINTSTTNGNIKLNPNGTGVVEVKGDGSSSDGTIQLNCSQNSHGVKIKSPAHSAGASYTLTLPSTIVNSAFLQTDSNGNLSFTALDIVNADINASAAIARTKLANVDLVDDTSPQLGGNLDVNTKNIVFGDSASASDDRLVFGAGSDLEIFHDSNNSFIKDQSGTGNLKISSNQIDIVNALNSEFQAKFIEDGAVELYFDGTKRFETTSTGVSVTGDIAATGNVGIGTTSPTNQLHVYDSAAANDTPELKIESFRPSIRFKDRSSSSVSAEIVGDNCLKFSVSTPVDDNTALTERMRIDSSGNVGIGTSNPIEKLQSTGAIISTGSNSTGSTTGANRSIIDLTSGGTRIGHFRGTTSAGSGSLKFFVDSSEMMQINSSGKVGIGTTTPSTKFEVRDSSATGISSRSTSTQATDGNKALKVRNNSDTDTFNVSYKGQGYFAGSVGIGTTSPSAKLHVIEDIYAKGSSGDGSVGIQIRSGGSALSNQHQIRTGGGTGEQLFIEALGSSSALVTKVNGSERLRIDSSGRVGIGTASPSEELTISSATPGVRLEDTDQANSYLQLSAANGDMYLSANGASSQGQFILRSGNAGTFTERMRIDSGGRLLHGVTSAIPVCSTANSQLQVHNNASVLTASFTGYGAHAGGSVIALGKSRSNTIGDATGAVANGDSLGDIRFGGSDGTDIVTTACAIRGEVDGSVSSNTIPGRLVFLTNGVERMRITTKGRIASILDDNDSVGVLHKRHQSSNSHNFFEIRSSGSTTTSGGTLQFAIETDGDVKNTNNSYSSLSDIKLKENIVDAKSQWDDIKALKIRNYNFKSELDYGTYTQIGLIAQEVEETSPGLVVDNIDRDDEGKDLGTTTKTLRYSVLHIKALKALQEAIAKIETLETKVAALESA